MNSDVLLNALRRLAEMDPDRATERNQAGFSAFWSDVGHDLASRDTLTDSEAVLAARICLAHRRQVPPEAVKAASEVLSQRQDGCWVTEDGWLGVRIPYDPSTVKRIKSLPVHLRRWDPDSRAWLFAPSRECLPVVRSLTSVDAGWLRVVESRPDWTAEARDGYVLIRTDSPSVSDRLNLKSVGKWDPNLRGYRVPMSVAALEAIASRAGGRVPRAFEAVLSRVRQEAAERARLSASDGTEPGLDSLRERLARVLPHPLYPYQVAGVEFIERAGGRVLVGDEMGLGKTVQALAWLALHPDARPVVVFCPGMVRLNWVREIRRWLPRESVEVVVAAGDVRRLSAEGVPAVTEPSGTASVTVVNYETAARHVALHPRVVVLDECHWIKERRAQRTKAVLEVSRRAQHVLALSGTPVLNRPIELYNVLNLLRPDLFRSWWRYASRYCNLHHNGFGWDATGASNVDELARILRAEGIMVRRTKADVLHDLPPKRLVEVMVELPDSPDLDVAASDAVHASRRWLEAGGRAPGGDVLAAITRLRLALGMAKAGPAAEWVAQLAQDRPVVVFCHHVEVARTVAGRLGGACVTGEESVAERQAVVDRFQRGDVRIICATYGAAGVGLNLTAASDVVLVEREWVPAIEQQAADRCHRIGQTHPVTVWVVMTAHRVDRALHNAVSHKSEVADSILAFARELSNM